MDTKVLGQAILFAPAFLFLALLEGWGRLVEPRRDGAGMRPPQQ